jgi:hypothetical protein
MKRLITKVRALLDKEYEITLPGRGSKKQHHTKQPHSYVNPFKHQQELVKQQQEEIKQRQIEAIQKLQHAQELKRMREALNKPKPVKPTPPPPPPPPAPTPVPTKSEPIVAKPEKKKQPSALDKKIEININFPRIKKPSIKKPHIKKPHIKLPTMAIKQSLRSAAHSAAKYKKTVALAGIVLLGTAIIGTAIMRYQHQPQKDVKAITTKTEEPVDKKAKVIEAVSKRIELPQNEVPVLATVEDVEKLRSQDFFKDAQNGDKILMYRSSGKAFLYRPATDEVLVQAPLIYQDEQELIASGSAESKSGIPQAEPRHGKTLIEPR